MISSYLKLAIFCVTGLTNNDVDFACPVTVLHIKFKSEPRIAELHIPLISFYCFFLFLIIFSRAEVSKTVLYVSKTFTDTT